MGGRRGECWFVIEDEGQGFGDGDGEGFFAAIDLQVENVSLETNGPRRGKPLREHVGTLAG
jgi:hypothetical protein